MADALEPDTPASAARSDSDTVDPVLVDELRLNLVSGIGPRLRQGLIERFGSATAVLAASPSDLREVSGIGSKLGGALAAAPTVDDALREIERARELGVDLLHLADPRYPAPLREVHDPPAVLSVRGQWLPGDALAVGIVGSRHATHYGLGQARKLAASLASAGLTIVSGLARGVDAVAHRGALEARGRTLAVLGGGLGQIYPPVHAGLADEVAAQGALISEQPLDLVPFAGTFPQRNRIISGLVLGVIVIEAGMRSGALITARHAMEQGREVFALPGRVDNPLAQGCHRLLRDGARLVETADDVLEELGPLVAPAPAADGRVMHHPAELLLNDVERRVLDVMDRDATAIDEIVVRSGLAASQVLATISALELRRLVRRISGQLVVRV